MRSRVFSALAVVLLVFAVSANASLLPADPNFTLVSIQPTVDPNIKLRVNTYTDTKSSHNWDVICPLNQVKFGTVEFEYAPYTGDFDGGTDNDFGGAIIRGGFKKTKDPCPLIPGTTFRWLQHIIVTGDETTNKIDGDPLYPNHTAAGFEALLFDAPGRGVLGTHYKNLSWQAESALVCINDKKVQLIASFLWGFDIVTTDSNTTVVADRPALWSPVTSVLKNQFIAEYGGAGWTIEDGCCCVPEPTTLALLVTGILALRRKNS